MRSHTKVQKIAQTAILLALCILFQTLKGFSVYITGSMVNCILIIATWITGLGAGLVIACVAPFMAYLLGATPVLNLIPAMLPVILVGNVILVVVSFFGKKKLTVPFLLAAAVSKAVFLWLSVWYLILPIFGGNIPEAKRSVMVSTIKIQFSLTQLITALIGGALAYIIYQRIHKEV